MNSQFTRQAISLAAVAVIMTAWTVVSAQTSSVDPPGDASINTISNKRRAAAKLVDETKPASSPFRADVIAVATNGSDIALAHENALLEVPGNRSIPPTNIGSSFETEGASPKTESVTSSKQSAYSSEWEFAFAPYLYASGISGTVGARGRVLEVDASFGNILENLDLGIMGTFEARKGKFVVVSDLIWTKMSAERDTPGGLYSTAKLGVNLFIFDPEIGYRIADSKTGSFDVLGGVRIWSVENNLNLTTGLLPGFDVSQRKSWAAPVVGFRGILNVSPKFFLSTKFDIGGAGVGADLTTQFYGGVGFRLTPKIALIGGYRYLQVDYDDSEGFLFDTKMNGFVIGAKFGF